MVCFEEKSWGFLISYDSLQWRHNEYDGVSNHQSHDCLLKRLFRRRSKKTLKLRITGLCEGNSPVTGEFRAQRASNAENISIWWRHHVRMIHQCITRHKKLKLASKESKDLHVGFVFGVPCLSICNVKCDPQKISFNAYKEYSLQQTQTVMEYIPRNIHVVRALLCFVVVQYRSNLPTSVITALIHGRSHHCPSVREAALKNMSKWIIRIHGVLGWLIPPGQNGRHFANVIFRCIVVNEKFWILIKISLKLVPKSPIDNIPALVKIMAWCRIGDKSLSETMLTLSTDAYVRH